MKQQNYSKGKLGESLAQNFLIQKGFQPLDHNFHTRFGEIDLIMIDSDTLVFVEVKLKIGSHFGNPEDMISTSKIKQIQKTAQSFIQTHPLSYSRFRLDAVCIVLNQDNSVNRINHYENLSC